MGYTVYTTTNTSFPGVQTAVTQTIDFSLLEDHQLRRCIRAVERGHLCHTGYIQGLVRSAAKHLNVSAPLQVQAYNGVVRIYGLDRGRYEDKFSELITLSDVRHQFEIASRPSTPPWMKARKSGWEYGTTFALYGWAGSEAEGQAAAQKVLMEDTSYKADIKKLAAFIATKPKFTIQETKL